MEKIRVIITNNQKAVKVPTGVRMLIRRCCHAVLRMEKFEDSAEISVTFVDNEQIRELNAQYRNKDAATDVLSFPMGENGVYDINHDTRAKILGDIVLSVEMAMAQAKRRLLLLLPTVRSSASAWTQRIRLSASRTRKRKRMKASMSMSSAPSARQKALKRKSTTLLSTA